MGNEKNCTCNSRTVDDSWNLIHSDDCELNKQITMKRQLATEWLIDNISPDLRFALETIYNKAVIEQAKQKEIENLEDAYLGSTTQFANDARVDYPKAIQQYIKETYGIDK